MTMTKKALVVSALAVLMNFGTPASASAEPAPPVSVPPAPGVTGLAVSGTWVPVFYFGTQAYCNRAGMMGQSIGVLAPGEWMCDSGWLMKLTPPGSSTPPPAPSAPAAAQEL
jgi:hypothetical protein